MLYFARSSELLGTVDPAKDPQRGKTLHQKPNLRQCNSTACQDHVKTSPNPRDRILRHMIYHT